MGAIAIACIALSLAGVLVHALGLVSAPVAVTVVLLPVGAGLRVAFTYAGRAAGSVRRTQVMTLFSSIGLGISALNNSAFAHVPRNPELALVVQGCVATAAGKSPVLTGFATDGTPIEQQRARVARAIEELRLP